MVLKTSPFIQPALNLKCTLHLSLHPNTRIIKIHITSNITNTFVSKSCPSLRIFILETFIQIFNTTYIYIYLSDQIHIDRNYREINRHFLSEEFPWIHQLNVAFKPFKTTSAPPPPMINRHCSVLTKPPANSSLVRHYLALYNLIFLYIITRVLYYKLIQSQSLVR